MQDTYRREASRSSRKCPATFGSTLYLTETSPEETQAQFNTNVFGGLNTTRAFLPIMRAQKSGVIANISSVGAWRGVAGAGLYAASKWAVSAFSETLTEEVAEFGIKVCCIEPGYFRSNFLNAGNRTLPKQHIAAYDGTAARRTSEGFDEYNNNQPGDIKKGAKVMVTVLTGEDVPMRLVLGSDGFEMVNGKCKSTIELLAQWKDVSVSTNHD
jgi:NAD(P)-dependent dehydrogenase (short-subunit alcohol dehydrogenase family)